MILEIPITPIDLPDAAYEARSDYDVALRNQRALPSFAPVYVGRVADMGTFSAPLEGFPSLNEEAPFTVTGGGYIAHYEIPDGLEQFAEAVRIAAAYEHGRYTGADYSEAFAKLTVEQSLVRANTAQRASVNELDRLHRDGQIGSWLHSYLVTDQNPTRFYELEAPKPANDGSKTTDKDVRQVGQVEPGDIVMANSTTLHVSPTFAVDTVRTFMRLTYLHKV